MKNNSFFNLSFKNPKPFIFYKLSIGRPQKARRKKVNQKGPECARFSLNREVLCIYFVKIRGGGRKKSGFGSSCRIGATVRGKLWSNQPLGLITIQWNPCIVNP